jgi:two-component system alkaline phosphatase synthesis response regulator PhoP
MSDMNPIAAKGRILVVDDEPKVLSIVRSYLQKDGFQVTEAQDGKKALEAFRREKPDLIILDIMMSELDGLDVLREIRRTSRVPVILLTARVEETDRLVGLELGADDYVSKPFSPRELTARVKAVLRRAQKPAEEGGKPICMGDMTVDPERFEVTCHGKMVNLTATEFRIVLALAQSAGRVLSRQQLLERAMDMAYEGYDRTIDAHIKNIRHKLSVASGGEGCNITTVQGVGYKLEEGRCAEE